MYESQSNNAQSRLGGPATVPNDEKVANTIDREIVNVAERAAGLRSRLSDFRERALGGEPAEKPSQTGHPRPVPNGILATQRQHLEDAASWIEDCHIILSRLETIV